MYIYTLVIMIPHLIHFGFFCPSTHVDSDRLWNIGCKPFVGVASACSWSGPINLFEKELNYNCPANSVITGVYSNYNHNHEDRRWVAC